MPEKNRACILGCEIDRLDMQQTVARCRALVRSGKPAQHVSINVAKLVALQDDPRLREIVRNCEIVSADGQAVVWASRALGDPLPERVAGIDLMHALLQAAEEDGVSVYFLGARPEVLDRAIAAIRQNHPMLQIGGCHHGYFNDAESGRVVCEIREAKPQMLFVAMSSPRKEYWLADHAADLHVPFVMGIGGALDIVGGVARRAPAWAQRTGLEWAFRLAQEPRRLWRRYLVTNTRFGLLLTRRLIVGHQK